MDLPGLPVDQHHVVPQGGDGDVGGDGALWSKFQPGRSSLFFSREMWVSYSTIEHPPISERLQLRMSTESAGGGDKQVDI